MGWLESPNVSAVLIAFFTMLGAVLGSGTLAQLFGRKKSPAPPTAEYAEVKGALISDKAADRVVQSSDAFTAAAMMLKGAIERDVQAKEALTKALYAAAAAGERMVESGESNRDVLRSNTIAANAVATQAHDLRDVLADMTKELEFQSRIRGRKE